MKMFLYLALAVAILSGGCGAAERETAARRETASRRETDVAHLSLIQLIASPHLHDSKRITAIGYLRLDFEGTALYIHEVDYRKFITPNAVWLHFGPNQISKERQRLNGRYALIEGRFSAKQQDQISIFSGTISEITNVEPWPPENLVIPPGDPRSLP